MANQTDVSGKPTCFVIMPISDAEAYEPGHFGRVYEHLLKPAISRAGYDALRADDTNKTDYIVVGIIQRIVESEMVLCDLSAKNANVMYELGIRHAFNKPVTLVKDRATDKVFDIQGLRYTEYSHGLRIDSVEKDIDKIAKAIKETATADASDINSVIQLAGLRPAEVPAGRTVSPDTQVLLSAIAALEQRFAPSHRSTGRKYFVCEETHVVFIRTKEHVDLGAELWSGGKSVGRLVAVDPVTETIAVQDDDGAVKMFSSSDPRTRDFSEIPF